jgi:hypothetical protein
MIEKKNDEKKTKLFGIVVILKEKIPLTCENSVQSGNMVVPFERDSRFFIHKI